MQVFTVSSLTHMCMQHFALILFLSQFEPKFQGETNLLIANKQREERSRSVAQGNHLLLRAALVKGIEICKAHPSLRQERMNIPKSPEEKK